MGRPANTIQDVLLRLVICEPTTLEKGCWEWPGSKVEGYGVVKMHYVQHRVHRLVYQHFIGPIPDGLNPDHLCRNRACANFEHLEPVTQKVNANRGMVGIVAAETQLRKTHCPKGHPYSEENTYNQPGRRHRVCRTCRKKDRGE